MRKILLLASVVYSGALLQAQVTSATGSGWGAGGVSGLSGGYGPQVARVAVGPGGFNPGLQGLNAPGGGLFGVTRRTPMAEANASAATFFQSAGVPLGGAGLLLPAGGPTYLGAARPGPMAPPLPRPQWAAAADERRRLGGVTEVGSPPVAIEATAARLPFSPPPEHRTPAGALAPQPAHPPRPGPAAGPALAPRARTAAEGSIRFAAPHRGYNTVTGRSP